MNVREDDTGMVGYAVVDRDTLQARGQRLYLSRERARADARRLRRNGRRVKTVRVGIVAKG